MKVNVKAFTLPELLIVLVIIGILVLLALPRLMPLISRTKATEAQLQLKQLQTLEKSYFYLHSKSQSDFGVWCCNIATLDFTSRWCV
jgi:type IV pilus assembly protein PilE